MDLATSESIENRIASLEKVMDDSLNQRLERLEDVLKGQIEQHVDEMEGTAYTFWLPFVGLSLAVSSCLVFVWTRYRGLRKKHQL